MRTLDHEIIDPTAFLKEVLGVVPTNFRLDLEGVLAETLAGQLAPFVVKDPWLWRWLQPTCCQIPAESLPGVLGALCAHAGSMRLAWLALRSSDGSVTWFEAPHFGDEYQVQLHDGFPEELASRLRAAGVMKICDGEAAYIS